jgi:hypothetical protein
MKRWMFNIAAVVSLLLCVACAALWVYSRPMQRADHLSRQL